MKILSPICVVSIALLFTSPLRGEESAPPPRTIEVTGTATSKAEVDRVAWSISLRTEADTLAGAMESLAAATGQLQGSIANLANVEVGLRFSRIRSGRLYNTVERLDSEGRVTKEQIHSGFFIERAATVRSEDLEASAAIETILLQDERIQIGSLSLTTTEYENLKKRAIRSAVEAAKEKAELMISVFPDLKLGPVLQMREGSSSTNRVTITENRIEMPVFHQAQSGEFDLVSVTSSVSLKISLE
ncbi:MAG: SIMPL domain-containing protein [Verrucomicrobiota bacterium]